MPWVIGPQIPLNPPNRPSTVLDHENVSGLGAIDAWTVFDFNTRRIEGLVPPYIHMGGGEPCLKQREIGSAKGPECHTNSDQIAVFHLEIAIDERAREADGANVYHQNTMLAQPAKQALAAV